MSCHHIRKSNWIFACVRLRIGVWMLLSVILSYPPWKHFRLAEGVILLFHGLSFEPIVLCVNVHTGILLVIWFLFAASVHAQLADSSCSLWADFRPFWEIFGHISLSLLDILRGIAWRTLGRTHICSLWPHKFWTSYHPLSTLFTCLLAFAETRRSSLTANSLLFTRFRL